MTARVSFPMYDLPGLEPVWDNWWTGVRRHMIAAGIDDLPDRRIRLPNLGDHWQEPDTVLTHTCGYPYMHGLSEQWRLVATPCFRVSWCDGPRYRNLVLVGRSLNGAAGLEDLRGCRVAYNGSESHSGYNSLRAMVAPLAHGGTFFSDTLETGSHLQTLEAVRSGAADCGSVDCVTFALIQSNGLASTEGVSVVAGGPLVPGLPLIAPRSTCEETLDRYRSALNAASRDPEMATVNATLLLDGFAVLEDKDYAEISAMRRRSETLGYHRLH